MPTPIFSRVRIGLVLLAAAVALSPASVGATARCSAGGMPPQMFAAYVEGIQRQLLELGFAPGRNDGVLGSATYTAIRAYQRRAGLPATGCPSKELLDHMTFAQPRVSPKASGPQPLRAPTVVEEIQRELTRRGYYLGPVDGRPGPKTQAAAAAFLNANRLVEAPSLDSRLLARLKDSNLR